MAYVFTLLALEALGSAAAHEVECLDRAKEMIDALHLAVLHTGISVAPAAL